MTGGLAAASLVAALTLTQTPARAGSGLQLESLADGPYF